MDHMAFNFGGEDPSVFETGRKLITTVRTAIHPQIYSEIGSFLSGAEERRKGFGPEPTFRKGRLLEQIRPAGPLRFQLIGSR